MHQDIQPLVTGAGEKSIIWLDGTGDAPGLSIFNLSLRRTGTGYMQILMNERIHKHTDNSKGLYPTQSLRQKYLCAAPRG